MLTARMKTEVIQIRIEVNKFGSNFLDFPCGMVPKDYMNWKTALLNFSMAGT